MLTAVILSLWWYCGWAVIGSGKVNAVRGDGSHTIVAVIVFKW